MLQTFTTIFYRVVLLIHPVREVCKKLPFNGPGLFGPRHPPPHNGLMGFQDLSLNLSVWMVAIVPETDFIIEND